MKRLWIRKLWLTAVLASLSGVAYPSSQEDRDDTRLDYYAPVQILDNLIRETIERNPRIGSALADYRAAIQKIPQVPTLPDPMVTFTKFVRSPETRVGPQTSSLMVSQRFPWFGKLDLDGKIAVSEASVVYEQSRTLERDLAASVKDAFFELGYLDSALRITREEQALLEYYADLAETRYETGEGLQYAVIRVQEEITRVLNRLETLGRQRASAAGRLNTLRSRTPSEPLPEVLLGNLLPGLVSVPDSETLIALGDANRPELRAALDEIEKHDLMTERARRENWPDLTLSAGLVNVDEREDLMGIAQPPPDNGKNAFSISVAINIPIHRDRYRAAELQAVERRAGSLDRYAAIRDEMRFQIRDEVLALETLERQMGLYEQVLIPQAESALASAETAYETGLVGSTELLESERVLIDIRTTQARFLADYLKALGRLERAIGTRFPDL